MTRIKAVTRRYEVQLSEQITASVHGSKRCKQGNYTTQEITLRKGSRTLKLTRDEWRDLKDNANEIEAALRMLETAGGHWCVAQ